MTSFPSNDIVIGNFMNYYTISKDFSECANLTKFIDNFMSPWLIYSSFSHIKSNLKGCATIQLSP